MIVFVCFFLVPTVTIVVEGGKETLDNIYYDLKRGIPVLIIEVSLTIFLKITSVIIYYRKGKWTCS